MLSIYMPTYERLEYLKDILPRLLSQADAQPSGEVEVGMSDKRMHGICNYKLRMKFPDFA